jgi:hypothetical protein
MGNSSSIDNLYRLDYILWAIIVFLTVISCSTYSLKQEYSTNYILYLLLALVIVFVYYRIAILENLESSTQKWCNYCNMCEFKGKKEGEKCRVNHPKPNGKCSLYGPDGICINGCCTKS